MIPRRLAAVGAGVTALVAVAGLASHGRPFSGGRGSGPSATFFDYVATTLVIWAVVMLVVVLWSLLGDRTGRPPKARSPWHLLSSLLTLAAAALIATFILHTGFEQRLRNAANEFANKQSGSKPAVSQPKGKNVRDPRLRWDEIAIVLVLLGGAAVVVLAGRRARRAPRPWRLGREEAVSAALDESLDDLRSDPDLRRAIIAAYARMERALAGAGLARHPAEAPFEYVERALGSLELSAASAERLTSLFEWAKFSQHEPGPEMRDEAIEALVAVRDELRRPAREAVTV